MIKPSYNCSQQELYTACRLGWQSCQQYLTDFEKLKARYKLSFIADNLKEVEAASNLKDNQARGQNSEVFRINLEEAATECLANWQKLKRYIADAFPENVQKPMTEAAGQDYYLPASQDNWDSCSGLLKSGSIFIKENFATLTDKENMPDVFQSVFNDSKEKFDFLHQSFLDSEETAVVNTAEKITANNNIYSNLIAMFLDGQEIFKTKEAIQKQFIFDQVLNIVSGTGIAGIKGYITNAKDKSPIVGASVTLLLTSKTTKTDESGRYEITQVAAGKYQVVISAEGYHEKTITVQEVKVGTVSTLSVELEKL